MLSEYAGMRITRIRIALATNEGFTNLEGWVRTGVDGQTLGSATIAHPVAGWNEQAFDKPVVIEQNQDLAIGYSFEQTASCKCILLAGPDENDGFLAAENGYWSGKNGEWENRSQKEKGSVCVEIVIEDDRLPQKDAALTSVSIDYPQVRYGDAFTVSATATNKAMAPVSGITYRCYVDGKEAAAQTKAVTLANRESDTVSFELRSDLVPLGLNHKVSVSMETEGDEIEQNNTAYALFSSYDTSFDHKLLIEEFSTEHCPNCKRAIETFATLMDEGYAERTASVVHHVGYRYDWLTAEEDKAYEWFYGTDGTYAPAAMFDRRPVADYGGMSEGQNVPVTNVGYPSDVRPMLNAALSYPAFVRLEADAGYDTASRQVQVDIDIEKLPIFDTQCSQPRLTVYLVEDSIQHHEQAGYTSETFRHRHVYRKSLTDIWGDPVSFEGNNAKTHAHYTYTLPAEWNAHYVGIIAFVHERDPQDRNRNIVFNAAEADIKSLAPDGIAATNESSAQVKATAYYSPSGVRMSQPHKGICLQRTAYTDGRVVTRKITM